MKCGASLAARGFPDMQVAELTGLRHFDIVDRPAPDPGPGELQVKVAAIGICGSDMHAYSEGAVGESPCHYPMVIGHEPSGVVVKTGAGVSGFSAGDRGALEPALYCYHCEFCMRGQHNICAHLRFMSSGREPGYFRECVNIPVAKRFYISGFIKNPGSFVLDTGTTVGQAIILAGGLNDRGSDRRLTIIRVVAGKTVEVPVKMEDTVLPNDEIKVKSRFF